MNPLERQEADRKLEELYAGKYRPWKERKRLLSTLVPVSAAHLAQAKRLYEEADTREEGWLASELPGLPRELRVALYRLEPRFGRSLGPAGKPDPAARRVLLVACLITGLPAGHPMVTEALADPDPWVRALLARGYEGVEGDEDDEDEDEEEDDRASLDDVWQALARDPDEYVRAGLLWNRRSPLRPPASDPSPLVRSHHEETSARELRRLARAAVGAGGVMDRPRDLDILAGIVQHEETPEGVVTMIFQAIGVIPGGGRETILGEVRWAFSSVRYAGREALVEAVEAYHRRVFGGELDWDPDELVITERAMRVSFFAVSGGAYDDACVSLRTEDERGFTAAELLWRTHEALASYPLGDKIFFEGFSARSTSGGDAIYHLRQGS